MRWLAEALKRLGHLARRSAVARNRTAEHRLNPWIHWRLQRLEQLEERTLLSIGGVEPQSDLYSSTLADDLDNMAPVYAPETPPTATTPEAQTAALAITERPRLAQLGPDPSLGLLIPQPTQQSGSPATGIAAFQADAPGSSTIAALPAEQAYLYLTGFEPEQGFSPGYVDGQAGWTTFPGNVAQPIISTANPHPQSGSQHLRIDHDPSVPEGQNVGGFSPNLGPQPPGQYIVSVDVAISATGGANYLVVPQAPSQGLFVTQVNFNYLGDILVLDDLGSGPQWVDTGTDWNVGPYTNLTIHVDATANTISYRYGGVLIYTGVGGVYAGTAVEQVVLLGDNSQSGDVGDFDNLSIVSSGPNLTPYLPSGWSDKIVVSKVPGTNTDDPPWHPSDQLFVDFAVINNGNASTGVPFVNALFVDGSVKFMAQTPPPLDPGSHTSWEDISIGSLPAGTHTITMEVDFFNEVDESDETDNSYTKPITITPEENLDWGDAPDPPYPTLSANNGASHLIGGPWLGDADDAPDPEPDGQPYDSGYGDDLHGNDDEDGLSQGSCVHWSDEPNPIEVTVNGGGGVLEAWIDWNDDGTWDHPGEQIHAAYLADGTHEIYVTPPAISVPVVETYARFRISTAGGLAPDGPAPDGEVEDYFVWIFRTPGLLDNIFGPPQYEETGDGWGGSSGGFLGTIRWVLGLLTEGTNTATWTVENLPPGNYQVMATWVPGSNRAANAPYTILDGAAELGTVRVNQRVSPDDDLAAVWWEDLGVYSFTSGTAQVKLTDDADGYVIADAIWVRQVPDLSWPSAVVPPWNAGVGEGFTIDRTYGVAYNEVPADFTIAYYYSTDEQFDEADPLLGTETITASADKTVGTHPGTSPSYAIATAGVYHIFARIDDGTAVDESDERNNVSPAGMITIDSRPQAFVDDGDANYTNSGWVSRSYAGAYKGDYRWHAKGDGSNRASWTVKRLPVGNYEVLVRWVRGSNRATDAPYTVLDGAVVEATLDINQRVSPDDLLAGGVWWESLGVYAIDTGTLTVELSDDADYYVIADAVCVRKVPDLSWAQLQPVVPPWHAGIGEGFSIDRTYEIAHNDVVGDFTIAYYYSTDAYFDDGVDPLLATETITASGDKTVGSHPGTSPSYSIAEEGVYHVFARIDDGTAVDESDETNNLSPAGMITIDATVQAFVDDGDGEYTDSGDWVSRSYAGAYKGDYRWYAAGDGTKTASWTVKRLPVGNYEVLATWVRGSNRATNAPYTVLDGAVVEATVDINQRLSPDDESAGGVWWESLGVYTIDNGTLTVRLSDDANNYVIADAIWVRQVGGGPLVEADLRATGAEDIDPRAVDRIDLVTEVSDELGHIVRLQDLAFFAHSLTSEGWHWRDASGTRAHGVRDVPGKSEADAIFAHEALLYWLLEDQP